MFGVFFCLSCSKVLPQPPIFRLNRIRRSIPCILLYFCSCSHIDFRNSRYFFPCPHLFRLTASNIYQALRLLLFCFRHPRRKISSPDHPSWPHKPYFVLVQPCKPRIFWHLPHLRKAFFWYRTENHFRQNEKILFYSRKSYVISFLAKKYRPSLRFLH